MSVDRITIPISGGSHTGKTTLLGALRAEFADAYFAPEPATIVITRQLEQQERTGRGALPWTDNHAFSNMVIEEAINQEMRVPPDARLVFKDRSLMDALAYSYADNFPDLALKAKQHIGRLANYNCVFFCEPVGEYALTEARRETLEVARSVHSCLRDTYAECGVPIVALPNVSVDERIKIVRRTVALLQDSVEICQ